MKNTIVKAIASISIPLLLISVSLLVFLFSKGYRLDFDNREIQKTGMISISSTPKRASIYLDEKESSRTPRSISGIIPGLHNLRIEKEGYYPWTMEINVKEEQTAILSPTLYLKAPELEKIYPEASQSEDIDQQNNEELNTDSSQTMVNKILTDQNNQTIAYSLIKNVNTNENSEIAEEEDQISTEPEYTLELWTYPVNRSFWQFNVSPQKLTEFSSIEYKLDSLKIEFSPDNQWILASLVNNGETPEDSTESTTYFLLESNTDNQTPQTIDELSNHGIITPTWAQNSRYIVYSKNNELRSLNIETKAQYVIKNFEAEKEIAWTSDQSGYIYTNENNTESNEYSISRIRLNGENQTTLIEPTLLKPSDSNSENLNTESKITDIHISSDYLIAICEDYIHIHPIADKPRVSLKTNNAEFIEFSPNEDKFLYYSEDVLNSYTLEIEEGDPIHKVGKQSLIDLKETNIENPRWSTNNNDVFYIQIANDEKETKSINVITLNGINNYQLITDVESIDYSIGNSGKYILTLDENSFLVRYSLHE